MSTPLLSHLPLGQLEKRKDEGRLPLTSERGWKFIMLKKGAEFLKQTDFQYSIRDWALRQMMQ